MKSSNLHLPEKSGDVEGDGRVGEMGGEKAGQLRKKTGGKNGGRERRMFQKIPQCCCELCSHRQKEEKY